MDLNKLKIAYSSYSEDFSFPGDRRRFCFFAKETNLKFSKFKKNFTYDIVVLSPVSDLSDIKFIKSKGTKIIFELVDSYFIKTNWFEDTLRYLGKKFIHKNYSQMLFPRRYTTELKKVFSLVDAVICTTEDQKRSIEKYNPNVHIVLDNSDDNIMMINPSRYNNSKSLNILWEGLASNLINFKEVSTVLNETGKEININLHILTDLVSYKYFSKFYKVYASDIMSKYKLKVNTYIYQWNSVALASLASVCDLAIIPLLQSNKFVLGKPENKLILLWKLGLPVLTSHSKVYSKTMKRADIEMICKQKDDWKNYLIKFSKLNNEKRKSISNKVKEFADKNYTKKMLIDKWNKVFLSIL